MNNLFILVGPSASGKTTIEEKLIEKGYIRYVTDTTRDIREGEVDGIHYNFISIEEFLQRDYANVIHITDTWKYGASGEELRKLVSADSDSVYSVINIEPAINIKKYIEENNILLNVYFIFFDIDTDTRIELMRKRGETEEDIKKRLSREESVEVFHDFGESPDLIVTDLYTSFDTVYEFMRKKFVENVDFMTDTVLNHSFEFTHKGKTVEEVIESLEKEGLWK